MAKTIQYQVGAGTRSASATGAAGGAASVAAGASGLLASAGGGESSCASSFGSVPASASGSCSPIRPAEGSEVSVPASSPPICWSPAVLSTTTGAVLARYMVKSRPPMKRSGSRVMKSCVQTVRAGTPGAPPSDAASPANALRRRGASTWATVGSATRRSLSGSGGMSAGFSFASTMR